MVKPKATLAITAILIASLFLLVIVFKIYGLLNSPDLQCSSPHSPVSELVQNPQTDRDFFEIGNYYYDIGNCNEAIAFYTRAIEMNLNYAESYNNRAYTNMRLRNYADALVDLDKALALNPNYVQALMNRGDIHNYYYQLDRKAAIADYERVLSLGKSKDLSNSVCGHKAMAETNHLIPLAILKFVLHRC